MFSWAQQTFDKLSQTMAPPPTDGAGRFAYAVQQNDEASAMGCLAEIDAFTTIVNQSKGLYPIHMACQYSMIQLVRMMMNQPGASLDATDGAGNTPMHHAAMSTKPDAMQLCKILISEYGALATVKNFAGQTPYDVSSVSTVRQYLLPIQLQAETQHAIDNGGMGLPPGIDMGGLRIKNSAMPPPPSQFGQGPPSASAPAPPPPMGFGQAYTYPTASAPVPAAAGTPSAGDPSMFGTPSPVVPTMSHATPSGVSPAPASMPAHLEQPPTSGNREYARVGSSSAAIFSKPKDGSRTFVRPDGFHSSSSDVSLQKKYGHQPVGSYSAVPPPPSSGGGPLPTAPMSAGANPFAAGSALGGGSRYGALPPSRSRYVAYGPTGVPAAPSSQPIYNYHAPAPAMAPNVTMFTPGGAGHQQQQAPAPFTPQAPMASPHGLQQTPPGAQLSSYPPAQHQPDQLQAPSPSSPFMPPPPYQTQNYQTIQQQEPTQTSATPSTSSYDTAFNPSPSGSTYGSTMTPGAALGTPGGFGLNPSSVTSPGSEAKDLFSSPPRTVSDATSSVGVGYTSPTGDAVPSLSSPQGPSNPMSQPSSSDAQHLDGQGVEGSTSSSAQALFGAAPGSTLTTAAGQPSTISPSKSAEELFGEGPPVEQSDHRDDTLNSEPAVHPSPQVETPGRVRAMSADELFAAPAPSPQQPTSETSAPDSQPAVSYSSSTVNSMPQGQDFLGSGTAGSGSAEDVFGASAVESSVVAPAPHHVTGMSGGQPSMSQGQDHVASASASDVFGVSGGTAGSGSAEQVFGAAPVREEMASQSTSQDQPAREATTTDFDGESEEFMTEVPLTPGRESRTSMQAEGASSQQVQSQPSTSAAPSGAESLFAAIGLPPPPMSSRR